MSKIRRVNFRLNTELSAPMPNIRGTVPRLKRNIEISPAAGLPVDRA
jgi:hypothetical protein